MEITDELLEKVANLGKLALSGEEKAAMKHDFQKMLDFVSKLQEVDTQGVEPLIHITQEVNRLRKDQPELDLEQAQVLHNAPDAKNGHFRVPKVVKK
jgi:aspartyl-tRNA(Asn)/glutamyl-tRNA(Gln) amidotransferase subunit C